MDPKKIVEFMELLGKLKHLPREGWVIQKVAAPETISGHMYRMAVLTLFANNNLDKDKMMKMALVHDLAECIVGDITPHCGVPVDEKHRREEEAMKNICSLLGDQGNGMLDIFLEYEQQQTPEAKYVKDLDRLDLLVQAFEYEKRDNTPGELEEFFANTKTKINDPHLLVIVEEVLKQRENLSSKKIQNGE